MEWIWPKRGRDGTGIAERRQRKTFPLDCVRQKTIAFTVRKHSPGLAFSLRMELLCERPRSSNPHHAAGTRTALGAVENPGSRRAASPAADSHAGAAERNT